MNGISVNGMLCGWYAVRMVYCVNGISVDGIYVNSVLCGWYIV